MTKLKQYHYEFEWRHGARSMITKMTIRARISGKVVSETVNGAMVYDIRTNEPSVRMISMISLQHIDAIVEEIKREREVLNAIRD